MDEFQEADVFWPEEDVRQLLAGYSGGGQQQQGGRRRHCGPPAGAGVNPRVWAAAAPGAVPSSAPAGRRHRQPWAAAEEEEEFARDEEGEKELVPPHLVVARRLSGKTAFSMCTGQGRTLKGRDLSQVRNSVLRLTGFLEG